MIKKESELKATKHLFRQIYWIISYHQYINQEAGMQVRGENYILEEYKMPKTCCANFDKLEKTTASLVQKR